MHFLNVVVIWLLCMTLCDAISPETQQVSTATLGTRIIRDAQPQWHVKFIPDNMTAHMDTVTQIVVEITNIDVRNLNNISFRFKSSNADLAKVDDIIMGSEIDPLNKMWRGNITINVMFLGSTRIYAEMINNIDNTTEVSKDYFELIIIRKVRVIDHVFTGSVILLVSLLYINFGAALDVQVLRGLITRPVSPTIGFLCQYILMPLLSFAVGYFILFQLFSWQILLAGLLLPWLGYIIAWCLAKTLKRNTIDSLTIAIETGIQNTGIAIFLLRTLPQPQADLTIVIPVAVDIMTMLPLVGLYIYQKCSGRNIKDGVLTEEQQHIRD